MLVLNVHFSTSRKIVFLLLANRHCISWTSNRLSDCSSIYRSNCQIAWAEFWSNLLEGVELNCSTSYHPALVRMERADLHLPKLRLVQSRLTLVVRGAPGRSCLKKNIYIENITFSHSGKEGELLKKGFFPYLYI